MARKDDQRPPRPGWKWGKGLALGQEREGTCEKGGLSAHCHIPPRLKSHLGSSWQVPFQPWLRFQVTMEIYRLGKSGLINAEVISRLA